MVFCFLRVLLFIAFTGCIFGDDGQVTFVSELSSKPAQKLSKYGWYGNVRLQRFHIPEETAIARWLFSVTKGHTFRCGQHNVSIHIQWGAPPVINPIGSVFPNATLWSPCLSLILPVTSHSSTTLNISNPAPGDWYVAAHLPEDDGRIEQKGFPSCSYFFQPQLSIRRAADTPILQQGTFLQQTAAADSPARLKLYVPEFASSLSVSVVDCSSGEGQDNGNCSLVLRLGSASLQHGPVTVNCSGIGCSAALSKPPWDTWLRVVVESSLDNRTVTFSIVSNYTVICKPKSVGLKADDDINRLRGNSSFSNSTSAGNNSVVTDAVAFSSESASLLTALSASACVWSIPVLYDEEDVLSLRFTPANGPNVSVTHTHPTLLTYPLQTQATGGTLNLELTLNTRWLRSADVRILRQLVVVHEGIEAMRWLMEEQGPLTSRGSSLTGSLSSLVTVEEHGPSVSPCRTLSPTQDLTETTGEDSDHPPHTHYGEMLSPRPSEARPPNPSTSNIEVGCSTHGSCGQASSSPANSLASANTPKLQPRESNAAPLQDIKDGAATIRRVLLRSSRTRREVDTGSFSLNKQSGEPETEHQTQKSFRASQNNTMEEKEREPSRETSLLGYDAQWCWVESQDDVTFL